MVHVDMTNEGESSFEPGDYLVKVKKASFQKAESGTEMFKLELVEAASGNFIGSDNINLSGKGWKIGREKLIALGLDSTYKGDISASDLDGKMARVTFELNKYTDPKTGKERTNLRAASNFTHCGYALPDGASTWTPLVGQATPF